MSERWGETVTRRGERGEPLEGVRVVLRRDKDDEEDTLVMEGIEHEGGDPSEIRETTPLPGEGDVDVPEEVEERLRREREGEEIEEAAVGLNPQEERLPLEGAYLRFGRGCDDESWGAFQKKPVTVRAKRINVPFECETAGGSLAQGRPGDYVVIDVAGYPYPCDPNVFEATHVAPGWPARPEAERAAG